MKKSIFAALLFAALFATAAPVAKVQASPWEARTVMTLGDTMVMPSHYPGGCTRTQFTRTLGLLNFAKDKLLCAKSNSAYVSTLPNIAPMGYIYLGTTADMVGLKIWMNPVSGTKKTVIVPANLIPAYASMGYQSIAVVGYDLALLP